jgi:peptidoglycan/xylan/chitin deacetylase (PgdA/CDA1 family)
VNYLRQPAIITVQGEPLSILRWCLLLGSHGCSHRNFADLSEAELRREMGESKARLEAILGHDVPALALPGGSNHPAVKRLAGELGYQHVFSSRVALAKGDEDPLEWPRIPITNVMLDDFLPRLMCGDTTALEHMGRSARIRGLIRRMFGNTAYDRLRSVLIRK